MVLRPLLAILLLGVASCAPSSSPLQILNFYSPTDACEPPKEADSFITSGDLDVVGGAAFYVGFRLESNLTSSGTADDLVVGGTTLEKASREAIVINNVNLKYRTDPPLAGLPADAGADAPLSLVIRGGTASGVSSSSFNIIRGDTIVNALKTVTKAQTPFTLWVDVKFEGYLERGTFKLASETRSFPITIERSGLACTRYRTFDGCGYPGQSSAVTNHPYCCETICGDAGTTVCGVTGCFF